MIVILFLIVFGVDIFICGVGLVGLVLVCVLYDCGWLVVVLE